MKLTDARNWLKRTAPEALPPPPVVLVPGERFFVRRVDLVAEEPAGPQIELALEGLSPFPADQMLYGYRLAPGGAQALVYAAYRRIFKPEELEAWQSARLVVPAFLALLGPAPERAAAVLHAEGPRLTGVVWSAGEPLPVAVLVRDFQRPVEEGDRDGFLRELARRAGGGLPAVHEARGETSILVDDEGAIALAVLAQGAEEAATRFDCAETQLDELDLRDRDFLAARAKAAKKDRLLWRAFMSVAALVVLALVLDVASWALGRWNATLEAKAIAQAPEVQRIDTAQKLAARIEELVGRRMMPLEMLAVLNNRRPASVQFLTSAANGYYGLEISAQTRNAADVGAFENALRSLTSLEKVETRDIRSRDGTTTFQLSVVFRPDALAAKGGQS